MISRRYRVTELRLTEVQVQERLTAPGAFFEMETVRVRGVDLRAWKGSPPTLRAVLEASRGHADKPFLVLGEERYSFAEHYRAVAALAQRLVGEYGVGKGDRLAIAMRNLPQWSVAFWAAVSVGAIAVPLNSWWTAEELEFALRDSGSRLVFTDSRLEERLSGVLPELGIPSVVTRIRADGAKDGDGGSPRLRDGAVYIDGLLAPANGPEPELPPVELGPEDDATILYTSGTTGRPKGALGTHRNSAGNILTTVYAGMAPQVAAGSTAEELLAATGEQSRVTLLSVPFFHATGLHSVLVCSIALGGELVLMHKWDPEEALRLIQRERVTGFGGVPTIAWQVLNHPRFAEYDTSSLTGVSYGGAPASPALVELIGDRLPERTPGIGYGLTETSAGCAYNNDEEYRRRPDSVGRPSPVADARIVGPDGEADLPVGEVGELLIRGPQVVTGYWNRPEATEVAFTDGWLHTGDLARLDDEGYIYIVDRAKDMVIRGGENVYCTEVESALVEHPAVFEVAVIGVPHRELGEEVGAVVHLRPGRTATPEELGEFLGKHLAAFKVPAHWWVREEELPHNPNGKLMKNQLRKELLPEG
jgi:long-chain acyl-CoA synthetase